jgi:hypothetical protein
MAPLPYKPLQGGTVIKVFNKETNEFLGRISEGDMQFLAEHLEEESIHDTDYYITKDTLEQFPAQGASPKLMEVLGGGLRNGTAIEIRWERDNTSTP